MASIVHKADGRIVVKHKLGGKWVYEYLGRGPAAQELAERKVFDLNLVAGPRPQSTPFGHLAVLYLQSRIHMSDRNKDILSYKFNSIIFPALADIDATLITRAEIDKYVTMRRTTPRIVTNSRTGHTKTLPLPSMTTIQGEIALILIVLNWAAYHCDPPLIADNPARGYKKGKITHVITDPPTVEEIAAIIAHASPHLKRAFILDLMCGARPGSSELFKLTWESVDFSANTITIISANKGGIPSRDIPLSRSLREHLLIWREEDLATGDKFIIHYKGGPVSRVSTSWASAKLRAGITRRLRMYDCRHYFVSAMLEGGADLKSVARMAGHVDETMVLRRYQHITSQMKRNAVDMIPDIPLAPPGTTGTTTKKTETIKFKQKQVVNR